MTKNQEHHNENQEVSVNVRINPAVKPIYADALIEVSIDPHCGKLLIAQKYQNELTHTDTIVLPVAAFFHLKQILGSINFDETMNDKNKPDD